MGKERVGSLVGLGEGRTEGNGLGERDGNELGMSDGMLVVGSFVGL